MQHNQVEEDFFNWVEDFPNVLKCVAEELTDRLHFFKIQPTGILSISWGIGNLSEALHSLYSDATIVCKENWEKICLQESNSFDLIVSNLAASVCAPSEFFSECQRVLKSDGLLLFSLLATDSSIENSATKEQAGFGKLQRYEKFEMSNLGDLLLGIGFKNPVIDLDHRAYPCSSLEQISEKLPYSVWSPPNLKSFQIERGESSSQINSIDDAFALKVIYGVAWKSK